MPHVPEHCTQAYHLFHLLLPSLDEREAFIRHLRRRSVQAIVHYMPLHLSTMGERFGGRPGDCPVAESVSDRVVRLPLYPTLSESDQLRILAAVCSF